MSRLGGKRERELNRWFQKVKARSVLRGDMMIKGVHYSIVFTSSPTITGNRIIQGLLWTTSEEGVTLTW